MSRLFRLHLPTSTQRIVHMGIYAVLVVMIILSILNVVTHPVPFPPRTSIGILTLFSLVLIILGGIYSYTKNIGLTTVFNKNLSIPILLFVINAAVSLLQAPLISDMIPFRMIVVGAVVYFISQIFIPTESQKKTFIHILGFLTVGIATFSVLYMIFPSIMNDIAYKYFSGKDAYGLIIDFRRGRLLHWGSIILCFPFFFASALLLLKNLSKQFIVYIILGMLLLTLSMVISNFRWTMFCYFFGLLIFGRIALSFKLLKIQHIFSISLVLITTVVVGLTSAKLVFNYNIIDRFLLSNSNRDIDETLGRFILYKQAIDLFLTNPTTGIGLGNYISYTDPFEYHAYYTKFADIFETTFIPLAAHNEFLTILAETGGIGLLLFLLIIYLTIRRLFLLLFYRYSTLSKTDLLLVLSLFVSYISFFLYVMFENIFPHNYIYLFFVSSITYNWMLNETPNKKTRIA